MIGFVVICTAAVYIIYHFPLLIMAGDAKISNEKNNNTTFLCIQFYCPVMSFKANKQYT